MSALLFKLRLALALSALRASGGIPCLIGFETLCTLCLRWHKPCRVYASVCLGGTENGCMKLKCCCVIPQLTKGLASGFQGNLPGPAKSSEMGTDVWWQNVCVCACAHVCAGVCMFSVCERERALQHKLFVMVMKVSLFDRVYSEAGLNTDRHTWLPKLYNLISNMGYTISPSCLKW